ncbi:hypothetical protein KUTeg_022433 [Tegillarca granosa]|uniref:Uncharacterized protein n=1 Tax=Tegillarca granosa TaxID=220873 RepID=A0ABQ9E925_TEGGR|nr:hypothetical protein KUTeg_022433 [Tegillarca granosa]
MSRDPYGYGSRSSSRQGQGYSEDPYYRGHYGGHYGQYDPYYQGQWNGYGYDQRVQEEIQPGRLTPEKYTAPHMRACLGPGGQLIKVLPSRPKDGQTGLVEVHELQALMTDDTVNEELTNFPGPLIRYYNSQINV